MAGPREERQWPRCETFETAKHQGYRQLVPTNNRAYIYRYSKYWVDESKRLPYGDKGLRAVYSLISCPWFERLWMWQEVRLANPEAVLMCGFDTLLWMSFRTAMFCIARKLHGKKHSILIPELFIARIREISQLVESDDLDAHFLKIMDDTRHCKYTDPRDRVYAILNLLEPSAENIFIEPDYEKTTMQVYQEVTLRYIDQYMDTNKLTSSGLNDTLSKMPTWVTDWTVVNTATPLIIEKPSGYSFPKVQHGGAGILSATVQHDDGVDFRDEMDLIAEIRRIAPRDILRGSYIGGGSLIAAYCKTLCVNTFSDAYFPPCMIFPTSQQSLDFMSAILQGGKMPVPDCSPGTQTAKFLCYIREYCRDRSFVKTGEGYMGLAPKSALPGDLICVLLGCYTPLLLRPTSDSQYQLVGSYYVPGFMNGEAFLGLVPETHQAIRIYYERISTHFWGFINHRTRETQYKDPNSNSLQKRIKMKKHRCLPIAMDRSNLR